ncbi:cytochrome-c peroxidase [Parasediminibacterium paludis]|uniref:Cytochrome-c peroxidase n=1 Tax=Parasediminibacterium paludis TaxID=908966 RepID=A0ABV8PS94_9BACT
MRLLSVILLLSFFIIAGIAWVSKNTDPKIIGTPIPFTVPKGWPQPVYDFKNNPLTQEGFALGRKLFYDTRLSKDGSLSCGSCHQQFAAFATYDHNLSHGINNAFTTRNAPSLANLAWVNNFMADGGINHLDLQPLAPITAPNEMGETIDNVVKKIKADTVYKRLFTKAFGDAAITTQRTMKALSQFMLLMVSSNSKYDKVMRGEANFILPEQLGYDIFKKKCANCHTEPLFTDFSYRNIGMPIDTFLNDYGRMRITRNVLDSLKFRVPSLRNVAYTAPYGHDGRFFGLMNVFDHYRSQAFNGPTTDSIFKNKLALSNFEIGQLTAFLYTLSDTSFLKDKRFAEPGTENTIPTFIHLH